MKKNKTLLLSCMLMYGLSATAQVELVNEKEAGISRRLQHEIEATKDPLLGFVPKSRLYEAYESRKQKVTQAQLEGRAPLFTWTERGPSADVVGASNGNNRPGNGVSSGRVRAMWQDLRNADIIWVGGIDGGLWRTDNINSSPANWIPINDYFGNLAVSAICQDPSNNNILYFGTGEKSINVDAVRGAGIWRSTDGGATWAVMPGTETFYNVGKLACDASGNLYAGNNTLSGAVGLQRYTKSTGVWTGITPSGLATRVTDIDISSTGRLHVTFGYFDTPAASSGYRYTDNPATVTSTTGWSTPATTFPTNVNAEMAVNGNTLYAISVNSSYQGTLYKSTNGGANWATTGGQPASGWASGQGWYSISLVVDPSNANNVIVGGLDNHKTTNGGTSWSKISAWVGSTGQYVHADQHICLWNTSNRVLFGCDGGVFYSSNGGTTITDRNVGLRIKQFYSVAIHPTSTNYFLGGTQDNGTHVLNQAGLGTSTEVTGGDGAYSAIDQDQPQYQFGAYVFNQYRRTTNGGTSWSSVDYSETAGQFINPFTYDNTANILYACGNANTYVRWSNPQTGSTFTAVSLTALAGGQATALKVSPFSSNVLYLGGSGSTMTLLRVTNANGTPSATNIIPAGMNVANTRISSIEFGNTEQHIIVTVSNYGSSNVWVTNNGGTTWTVIDGNLPDMPVRWALFYPGSNTKAIIATETGVWQTELINGASTIWDPETGFPNVRVDMLSYRASDRLIAAATHGRGIFSAIIPGSSPTTCNAPTGLAAGSITTIGATVSWTAATGAVSYDVDYKLSTATTWTNAVTSTTSTSRAISGLSASSTYDYRVRTNCAGSSSSYVSGQFTTSNPPSACPGTLDVTTNGTASGAATVPFNTDVKGLINTTTDNDYYKFVITTGGTATVTLGTLPADFDLRIYSSNGTTQLAISENGGTTSESISRTYTAGTYYARVYGYNGANSTTTCYTLKVQLGTAAVQQQPAIASTKGLEFNVFPNPAKNRINVSVIADNSTRFISIYDRNGKVVYHQLVTNNISTLDVSKLSGGMYFIKLTDENGATIQTQKFVKD